MIFLLEFLKCKHSSACGIVEVRYGNYIECGKFFEQCFVFSFFIKGKDLVERTFVLDCAKE